MARPMLPPPVGRRNNHGLPWAGVPQPRHTRTVFGPLSHDVDIGRMHASDRRIVAGYRLQEDRLRRRMPPPRQFRPGHDLPRPHRHVRMMASDFRNIRALSELLKRMAINHPFDFARRSGFTKRRNSARENGVFATALSGCHLHPRRNSVRRRTRNASMTGRPVARASTAKSSPCLNSLPMRELTSVDPVAILRNVPSRLQGLS